MKTHFKLPLTSLYAFFSLLNVAAQNVPDKSLGRVNAVEDINEFFTKAEHVHPDLLANMDPKDYLSLKKWAVDEVSGKMAANGLISVKDLAYALYYAAASFNDGHTLLQYRKLPDNYINASHFPPFLAEFRNGDFYVLSAQDRGLEGAEIISLNGAPFRDFIKPILDRCSSKLFHSKTRIFTNNQRFWWAFSGLFSGLETFDLEVREPSGRITVRKLAVIDTNTFNQIRNSGISFAEKTTALSFMEDHAIAYFKYHSFIYSDAEKANIDGIFYEVKKSGVRSLIIDMRGNGGGNSSMGKFIMKYISERKIRSYSKIQSKVSKEVMDNPEYAGEFEDLTTLQGLTITRSLEEKKQEKPESFFNGKVYLLVDNGSFSAASDFAAMFRDYECGKIIGYETGGPPSTSFGDVFSMTLKHSGVKFGVSYKKFYGPRPRPGDDEHGILPDIPITEELLSKFKTEDPALSFAVNYIKNAR